MSTYDDLTRFKKAEVMNKKEMLEVAEAKKTILVVDDDKSILRTSRGSSRKAVMILKQRKQVKKRLKRLKTIITT